MKQRVEKKRIDLFHIHIDNGGYTFEVNQYGSDDSWNIPVLEISESFFGYAEGKISFHEKMTPQTFENIGKFFFRAANRLRETGIYGEDE
jgi:hypothetical protein